MARNRQLLIFIVPTLVFAAAFFLLRNGLPGKRVSDAGFSLLRDESIRSIKLANEYGEFLFTGEVDGWLVESGGARYRANDDKMALLLTSLSKLPVRRVFDSELQAYGLDKPAAAVLVETDAGRRYEYSFGNTGADANTVYVKNGFGAVILTEAASAAQVTGNLAAYRDKKVFTVDLLNLARLEYLRGDVPVVSCRRESPTEWYMDYPYAAPARHIELTEFVAGMTGWVMSGYPDPVNPGETGLEPPLETLLLTDVKGNKQLLDFGKTEGLNRYVRVGNRDNVVFLYAADADLSVLTPDTLLFVVPLRAQMNEVTEFQVEQGGESWEFMYNPGTGAASWKYGPLTEQEFVRIFYKFISMTADGWDADIKNQTADSPSAATLVLNRKNGETARLELLYRDESTYFMRINGEDTPYYINAKRLLSLQERISDLTARRSSKSSQT
jgi:hypothetical protein